MKIERPCVMDQMLPEGYDREVNSILAYDTADPYAFTWTFYPPEESDGIKWTLSRDHLRSGTISPKLVGSGDVGFGTCVFGELIHMEIRDRHSTDVCIFHAPYDVVVYFLAATAKEVPFGKETAERELDRFTKELLGDGF